MECATCRSNNRDGRHYCTHCGAGLRLSCPACGGLNLLHESFCGACGGPLQDTRAITTATPRTAHAERRQLTVMFCDLVGSTALSLWLDPEDLREILHGFRATIQQLVAKYEGFVARYMGDGVLVYFGYPQAHEDDAARAIDTALEIVAAVAKLEARPLPDSANHLRTRIGIATGLVVVGDLIGEGASEESAAVGETPNLAAGLQVHTDPDSVIVASLTRQLAAGRFEYADEREVALKGYEHPVRASRVLCRSTAESRFDAERVRQLTPFIARTAELHVLLERWRRARDGAGQVVIINGEAGLGKSRLVATLSGRIADEPHIYRRYQCSAYRANSALHPFIEQLERAADFRRRDTPAEKRDKLEALLTDFPSAVDELVPLFAVLLSLPASARYPALELSPQRVKQKTLTALFEQLRALATRAPVLLVLEDAHWIDPTSLELLDLIVSQIAELRVLVILTARMATVHAWAELPHVGSLLLDRLDRDHSTALVLELPGTEILAVEVVAQIVDKSDGVPLYIEEITRTVVAANSTRQDAAGQRPLAIAVPSSLQASLMARIDRLGNSKEVAQVGAVIGREFSRDLLSALLPLGEFEISAALDRLVDSGLVFGQGPRPWTTFVFKHALVQDAAYAAVLRSNRQALHLRIAETLETSYAERTRTEPEVVAHHFTQAGIGLRAARYWAAAAAAALERSANIEALAQTARGLDLLAGVAHSPARDDIEYGLRILQGAGLRAVKGFASAEVERTFLRALELVQGTDDVSRMTDIRRGLFSYYYGRGEHARARAQGERVAESGERLGDRVARMQGYWMRGCIASWQGEVGVAREELSSALALYDPQALRSKTLALQIDLGVNARSHLSWVLWVLGEADKAVEACNWAVTTARDLAQPYALAMALYFACATYACRGEYRLAGHLLTELDTVTRDNGFQFFASCARLLTAQQLIAEEQCTAGIGLVDRALAEFRVQEAGPGIPWAMSIAATGYAQLGRVDEGLATIDAAFAAMARNDERHWQAELWRLKGELLRRRASADGADALACLRTAVDITQASGARALELRARTSLARALAGGDGAAQAAHDLTISLQGFTEGCDTADVRNARLAIALLNEGAKE